MTVLYRRDYTVHFWGLISVQLSNKNCYLIQSDIVGLGEVFLTVSDWEKYFWHCRIGISISGSVGLGEVFLAVSDWEKYFSTDKYPVIST